MTKTLKLVFILFSLFAFVVTCIWYYHERTWEPLAGIAVSLVALLTIIFQKADGEDNSESAPKQHIENNQTVTIHGIAAIPSSTDSNTYKDDLEKRKKLTNILFVDDDTKFKVVSILKTAGWSNTKSVKDISNLDEQFVKEAHIIFVDIQGVGKLLQTKDEGLGLALNLKKKYPQKRIVIYSAQTEGDRFHEALRKADAFLAKNAEPYEFLQIVEQYSEELSND